MRILLVLDANILIYALSGTTERSELYRRFVEELVAGEFPFVVPDLCMLSVARIAMNRRIHPPPGRPSTASEVMGFLSALRASRARVDVPVTDQVWARFFEFLAFPWVGTEHSTDAFVAALTIENDGRLITADRGFARFPGLRFADPVRR